MGYLEGLLGGFTARKGEVEQQNLKDAADANAREAKVYEALINSPDPEIRSAAITGLLTSTQTPQRKGGIRGWMGEMAANPAYAKIQALIGTPVIDESGPTTPPTAADAPAGVISTPPASGGSLAQSPTAATQVGTPPLRAVEPGPSEQTVRGGGAGGEGMGAPPSPAIATPPTAAVAGPPKPTMRPRQVFETPEQTILNRYSAQERGEILGVVAAYEAVGVPHDQAVKNAIEERMRSRGVGASGAQSIAGQLADGSPAFGVFDRAQRAYVYPAGHPKEGQPIPGFQPRTTTGSTSMGADRESIAREMFGKPAARLTSEEMAQVNARVTTFGGEKAGAVTTGRGEAAADVPLSTQQRFQATTDLSAQWTKATTNRTEMRRQFSLMQTGLSRYAADPIGGSQAVMVTFQKVLDPTSVVRESEYARSPQGLSIMDRLEGLYEKYKTGGAGVPQPILAEMVETARQFLTDENMKSALDNVRQRIYDTSTSYQIDPRLVLGTDMPAGAGRGGGTVGTPPPVVAAPAKPAAGGPGGEWTMVGGVLHHNGKPY